MAPSPLLFDDGSAGAPASEATTATGSWPRGVLIVTLIFLATRLIVWACAYNGAMHNFRLQHQIAPPYEQHDKELREKLADSSTPEYATFEERLRHFGPLLNFDGQHYRSIVTGGYRYVPPRPDAPPAEKEQNIAFFPLYPLLCQPLANVFGPDGAMVFVANAAAFAAALLVYFWARRRAGEPAAYFAVACVFCLPTACFYSFGYAESLTLLLTTLTLVLIERRAFWLAALACGLTTATRPTAAGLVAVFMLAYWWGRTTPAARRLLTLAPLTLLASAGLWGYAGYLTWRFGSPLVYFKNFKAGWVPDTARADWFQYLTLARVWDQFKYFGRAFRDLPISLLQMSHPFMWAMPLNFFILFLCLFGWPRVPRSFRPFLLLGPFIFLQSYLASGGANFGVEPIVRYMTVAVPAFIVLAAWMTRAWPAAVRYGLLTAMLLLQANWAFHFGFGEWSG